jgi:hypothetical protein
MTTRLDGSEAKKLRWAFAGGLDKVRSRIWKVRPRRKNEWFAGDDWALGFNEVLG